jgi:hypothetical protein
LGAQAAAVYGYSTKARRLFDLNRYQPQEDILHANLAYGRLALAQVLG